MVSLLQQIFAPSATWYADIGLANAFSLVTFHKGYEKQFAF